MNRSVLVVVAVLISLSLVVSGGSARKATGEKDPANLQKFIYPTGSDRSLDMQKLQITAVVDTYVLAEYTFDGPLGPDPQGWFPVDITEQPGMYFHIDDFDGLGGGDYGGLVPLDGDQSLWCGARPDAGDIEICNYAALPGYGNGWDQWFESVEFTASGDVTLGFLVHYDSEPGYDKTHVQYQNHNDEWVTLRTLDGTGSQSVTDIIPADSLDGAVKIRFQFLSDGAWSDQDGLYDTDGGVIIDQLSVSDTSGTLDYQTFETETAGETSTSDGDWTAATMPGYGIYAGLFNGTIVLQEDPCKCDATYLWGFFNGSEYDYACAGHPEQKVVPYENERGQYINNEIWSPPIDWHHDMYGAPVPASAEQAVYEFDVYRNLKVPALIYYYWHIRSWIDGCPRQWRDRGFCAYGPGPDWFRSRWPIGDLVIPGTEQLQLALSAFDMSPFWYIIYGTGECHSHSPLFDNARVYRLDYNGPQWSVRDIDLFQDTFPENGAWTGTGRIDMALDKLTGANPAILPGDSAKVLVSDPVEGLRSPDPYTGFGSAVYFYMHRDPETKPVATTKVVEDAFRWPLVDSVLCDGRKWYQFRMDSVFTAYSGPRSGVVPDAFCIDINDHYFTNGDTICFFFGAENAIGEWTYWNQDAGAVASVEGACGEAMEMQILPSGYCNQDEGGQGDILYVDNFSGMGAQPYFDSAFEILGIFDKVDRFDKRGPSSLVGNSVCNRATAEQLQYYYKLIIWNSGDLSVGTVGDGTEEKSNDYSVLYQFLDTHTNANGCGIYFSGDDLAEELSGMTTPGALAFKNTYMPYTLVSGDHTTLHRISPLGIGEGVGTGTPPSYGVFDHDPPFGVDTIVVYGGCPIINDFDVIAPAGGSTLEMCYDPAGPTDDSNPAVIAYTAYNEMGNSVRTVLSGFSFHYIRDDRPDPLQPYPDRADHLRDIIAFLVSFPQDPTPVIPADQYTNSLSQNYPNPFNPATTIRFSIRERGRVSLKIYNVAGRLVRTLVDGEMNPGDFKEIWNGRSNSGAPVSSGVYFYKLTAKNYSKTRKMVVLK